MAWINTLRAELRKFSTWFYATLLALLPYADSIVLAINAHLPTLAQYLPENIYKAVGFVLVMINIVRSALREHKDQS